jgi:hypothetical protein
MTSGEEKTFKILIISKYAATKETGFETRLFALSRYLVSKGNDITIISSDSNHLAKFPAFKNTYNHEAIQGIKTIWIKTLKYNRTVSVKRILSWLDFEWKLFWMKKKGFRTSRCNNCIIIIIVNYSEWSSSEKEIQIETDI